MIKVNKELNRASGGKIPSGSIWCYQIITQPKSGEVLIILEPYYSQKDLDDGMPHIQQADIKELKRADGQLVKGGIYKPDLSILDGLDPSTFTDLTDAIVIKFMEENFFESGDCESLGENNPNKK